MTKIEYGAQCPSSNADGLRVMKIKHRSASDLYLVFYYLCYNEWIAQDMRSGLSTLIMCFLYGCKRHMLKNRIEWHSDICGVVMSHL